MATDDLIRAGWSNGGINRMKWLTSLTLVLLIAGCASVTTPLDEMGALQW